MLTRDGIAAMRFGYGPHGGRLPQGDIAAGLAGPDRMAAALPGPGTDAVLAERAQLLEIVRRGRENPKAVADERSAQTDRIQEMFFTAARRDLARAVVAEDGFRERLVRFWADHFTVRAPAAADRPLVSAFVDDAIRPHVAGRFADMLAAVAMHPAMLLYLDQRASVGPNSPIGRNRERGLNENFARELLELHTLGVGAAYDQRDVRELAELLTGLTVDADGAFVFQPRWAEPGAETVLGQSYGGKGAAVLDDILRVLGDLAVRPETARHIAGKLAVHFVSDTPDPALVAALAATWADTGGDLLAVSRALAAHPAAWKAPLAKLRQPFDFIAAGLRALDLTAEQVTDLPRPRTQRVFLRPMAAMGQPWQMPRGPDGWPEDATAWMTPQALAARITWGMQVPGLLRRPLPDPRLFLDAALAGVADDALRTAVSRSEDATEGVGLVLASPAFNRR
ncbi:DUF1800 domain-containing protein [Ruixingdingia sedimenti]|uniref:DUF1800 domain-containing protein n=1 Tax=Ruixingdingia sedimenti TaxID=3073604 RepID=A0ABU1F2T2_9RHOB|nr:DUF1800 domain-containing protein [Xinfangfangia sp. LG-4]MDR5651162.1 DUF1800 domain-containing protein [Xinfangfangia sp. LG-4]